MADRTKTKGVSLAKGPVALVGLALLAFGIGAFILGGHSFRASPVSGTVNGENFLGVEVNAWSSLLFIGSGALLLFGAPLHWGAKTLSLVVGLVLGAASVIALYDESDVFGIFAANGPTTLLWGAAGALLIVLSLLPRVGRKQREARTERAPRESHSREPEPDLEPRRSHRDRDAVDREPSVVANRSGSGSRVVAPASGTTRESRETTRRQRDL